MRTQSQTSARSNSGSTPSSRRNRFNTSGELLAEIVDADDPVARRRSASQVCDAM
jgi:hypothetical protein